MCVLGGFGGGNFGNDASLEAALQWIRSERADAQLLCICSNPAVVAARFGVAAAPMRVTPKGLMRWGDTILLRQPSLWVNWWLSIRALRRCDLMIVAGGGVFHDYRDRPWGWPSRFLRWLLAARICGVPVALVSVGAGLILNPVSRLVMKQTAQLASLRSYRDEDSKAFMSALGVDESRSAVLPDLAFLLSPPDTSARTRKGLTIGLGMMNYRGWRENEAVYAAYIEASARFVDWLMSQGHAVRVVIGQTPTDLVAVDDLETRLGHRLMTEAERGMSSFNDVMLALADADIVVASRFHVQIAALKMRRPVLSLSYGPMSNALLTTVGLKEFIHDINNIEFDRLLSQFDHLIQNRVRYERLIDAKVSEMEAALPGLLRDLQLLGR